jgi:DNA-binding MarR family transcriptional regulator
MSETPTLNGQILGQAENATRAVLDRLLAENDATFHQWVTVNLLTISGSALDQATLVERMTFGLKVDAAVVHDTLRELTDQGRVTVRPDDPPVVELTEAGEALFRTLRAGIDAITQRLYDGLPEDDLRTAARILTTLTERANAELAA